MLLHAFEDLEAETPAAALEVVDGTITDPATGRQTSYWQLMGGKAFGRPVSGHILPKDPDDYTIVGQPVKRIDLQNKLTGIASYVQDLDLPDMLHARVLRPPGYHARLVSLDEMAVKQMPGVVAVVRAGSFLAVVASREDDAVRALEVLRANAVWETEKSLPPQTDVYTDLLNTPSQDLLLVKGAPVEDPVPAITVPEGAAQTLTAEYFRPFQMHGSLGPSAAAAHWQDGHLTIWSHTQGVFSLQAAIAETLHLTPAQIRVIHTEGAGCYGHNGADDAALDAALIARAVPGRPVLLKWSRADEHSWEPYGSAMVMQMQASLDASGSVIDWNHDVYSYTHSTRPGGAGSLLAARHLAEPFPPSASRSMRGAHAGEYRNAEPRYAFSRQRVVRHFVADEPLRTSALRSLGAYANVFAIESFMDELAHATKIDPLDFRLRHLSDERAKAVLLAAADRAGWHNRRSGDGRGWGIAFAQYKNRQCYAAVVVQLAVDRNSGAIQLEKATIAADAGQIINPDGLSNQLEGGFLQAASWTLFEQVHYNSAGITSVDWDTYPILRFSQAPVIETILLNRRDMPVLGSGEATQNPTPAAIANAVYAAVGVRLRAIPFTPERVKALL
jgi:nicotinate dehydrogenase subunit B